MINQQQLEEGLDGQIVNGGRLGTNLVELGHISEGQLADALQEQHQVVAAHGEIVPHEDALPVINAQLCDRHDVIPIRIEKHVDGESLYLGVVKPWPTTQVDELSRRLKMFVHQMIVPEFRMNQLLRKYAKAYRPVRQVDLTHAAKAIEEAAKKTEQAPEELMSEEEFQTLYANAVSGGRHYSLDDVHDEHHENLQAGPGEDHAPLHSGHEVKAKTVIDTSHHDDPDHPVNAYHPEPHTPIAVPKPPPPPAAEIVPPLSFLEAQAALTATDHRDEIAHAVMRYAAGKYLRSVLFVIHGDHLTGWEGVGKGLVGDAAKKVAISLSNPAFRQVRDSGKHFIGPIPQDATVQAFYKLIGGASTTGIIVPILVRAKVVNLLYADGGPGRPSNPDVAELEVLAGKVGKAYEAILERRKTDLAKQLNG